MEARDIALTFYSAFQQHDYKTMTDLYRDDIHFEDPAFGKLKGDKAKKMWEMLLANKDSQLVINFNILNSTQNQAHVKWEANYLFGPQKKPVHNIITAHLQTENGKIVSHQDRFSLWRWSRQAIGISGLLLGWTPYWKRIIQKKTRSILNNYLKNTDGHN